MAVQYCANCGTTIVPGERFCGECGNDLTLPRSMIDTPPASLVNVAAPPVSWPAPGLLPAAANQQGYRSTSPRAHRASRRPLIVAVVVILVLLAVGGYFAFFNKSSNNPRNQASISATATPDRQAVMQPSPTMLVAATDSPTDDGTPADPKLKAEVASATAGMQGLNSYHAKISGRYNGTQLQLEGDFSKAAAQFTLAYAGRRYNATFINDKQYISTDGGKSWKLDQSLASLQSLTSLFDNPALTRSNKLADLGNETLANGQVAHKIGIEDSSSGEQDTLWIVTYGESKVIARLQGTSRSEGSQYDLTLEYSNFNKRLDISEPKVN